MNTKPRSIAYDFRSPDLLRRSASAVSCRGRATLIKAGAVDASSTDAAGEVLGSHHRISHSRKHPTIQEERTIQLPTVIKDKGRHATTSTSIK
ncbi:hypothetical protein GUJ93_ZPchr0013g36066 [Zizania palustris]|uniref:Uncharacterized protein n=1 Tax=Zizania palustris TaxID=103762 RepID=A0A8J6C411_ZIZPA|nr:hypothetical protein GUJ93_ZPchr0013g36066 [Zizania palustris]